MMVSNVFRRLVFGFLLMGIFAIAPHSFAQDIPVPASTGFDHIVGVVAVAVPDYEGSDDQTFAAAPVVKWKYSKNRYFLLQGNKGYWNISNSQNWEFGLKGVYRLGRDDNVDDSVVKLMSEVDPSLELGAFVGWTKTFDNDPRHRFNATLGFTHDVSGGHEGYAIEASAVYWRPIARPFDIGLRGGVSYASEDYMSSYFGVSLADTIASGLSPFNADAGFKDVSLSLMGVFHFSQKWHLGGGINYKRLINDASDSPVVDKRGSANQWTAGLALLYTW
jgi:outer membrane protein